MIKYKLKDTFIHETNHYWEPTVDRSSLLILDSENTHPPNLLNCWWLQGFFVQTFDEQHTQVLHSRPVESELDTSSRNSNVGVCVCVFSVCVSALPQQMKAIITTAPLRTRSLQHNHISRGDTCWRLSSSRGLFLGRAALSLFNIKGHHGADGADGADGAGASLFYCGFDLKVV